MSIDSSKSDGIRLLLGSMQGDHVSIEPLYSDGHWIESSIEVKAGHFQGFVTASLCAEDFVSFAEELQPLYTQLTGEATFKTIEDWIHIHLCGDGLGHFEGKCELFDNPWRGNRLEFTIVLDQTELPGVLRTLRNIMTIFPVLVND